MKISIGFIFVLLTIFNTYSFKIEGNKHIVTYNNKDHWWEGETFEYRNVLRAMDMIIDYKERGLFKDSTFIKSIRFKAQYSDNIRAYIMGNEIIVSSYNYNEKYEKEIIKETNNIIFKYNKKNISEILKKTYE